MSVGLAWRRDTEASAGMRAFREYFRQSFLAPQQQQPALNPAANL